MHQNYNFSQTLHLVTFTFQGVKSLKFPPANTFHIQGIICKVPVVQLIYALFLYATVQSTEKFYVSIPEISQSQL